MAIVCATSPGSSRHNDTKNVLGEANDVRQQQHYRSYDDQTRRRVPPLTRFSNPVSVEPHRVDSTSPPIRPRSRCAMLCVIYPRSCTRRLFRSSSRNCVRMAASTLTGGVQPGISRDAPSTITRVVVPRARPSRYRLTITSTSTSPSIPTNSSPMARPVASARISCSTGSSRNTSPSSPRTPPWSS